MRCPLLPLCLAFTIGIALADRFIPPQMALESIVATSVVIIFNFLFNIKTLSIPLRLLPLQTLFLPLATALSCGIMLTTVQQQCQEVRYPQNWETYEMVITSETKEGNKTIAAYATITSGQYAGRNVRLAFDKQCPTYRNLKIGYGIEAKCHLRKPHDFKTSHFSFSRYLKTRNTPFVAFIGKGHCHTKAVSLSSMSFIQRSRLGALKLRHRLLHTYRSNGLSDESLAIAAAMSLGDKTMLSPSLQDIYSISGASHVLALSGTHLVIVFFIFSIFLRHYSRRWYGTAFLLSLTWSYVFLVGMSSSVVRSAIMISIFSLSHIAGRGKNSANSLATAATIMMALNPQVLFDAGFQLSVAAVVGILFATHHLSPTPTKLSTAQLRSPLLARLMPYVGLITIPISAQIATAPLVAYHFGRLPVYFLLTNAVVLPATTLILYLSAASLFVSPLPIVGTLFGKLLNNVIIILNHAVTSIASLPHSSIAVGNLSPAGVALCYSILLSIIAYLQLKSPHIVNNNKFNGKH